jgi:histidinol-phosphate aminotransferase
MLKPRECIAALEAYQSPITSRAGLSLDLNENAAGCSPRVLARLRTLTARDLSLYPERETGERRVADFLGVQPDQVLLTNGIDDALYLLTATYLGSDDEMLFADPTFVMYPLCGRAAGGQLVRVQADEDLALPADKLIERISPRTRLITIANPNNPTGMLAPRGDLLRILDAAPDAAVLVDEAYFEFGGETMIPELLRYPNLFIARTFSKAYGLAGLRLGALIGAPEQIGYARRFAPPFNVNAAALACLEEALADQAFVGEYVAQMKQGREQLAKLCAELGLRTWPSYTNFVLVRVGAGAEAFVAAMERRGIVVRNMSGSPGCEGCVRITVGMREQMDVVTQAMREALREGRG